MKRVESNENWSLFCPNEAPGLHEVYGEEFEALYEKYEKEGRAQKVVSAQKLWYAILEAQIETGGPFMTYKDSANRMSMISVTLSLLTIIRRQIESKEPGHHQVVQLVHRNHRVLVAGGNRRL
jgi:hypothetical protein